MKTEFRLFFFVSFFSNHCFPAFRSLFGSMRHAESTPFFLSVYFYAAFLHKQKEDRRSVCSTNGLRGMLLFSASQQNTNHSAISFVDDFFKRLLNFKLSIFRHVHQLIGQPFSDQVGERFAKEIALP